MKISIKEPCHENWDNMTPTEKGRFCGVCELEVADFTKMNKKEITDYFVNSKTEICARIEEDKLDNERKPRIQMRPIWVAAASMFVFSKIATPQIVSGKMSVHPENSKDKTQYNISTLNEKHKSIQIEFQIINPKSKKGIPYANIEFLDLKLTVKTDGKGNCFVNIPNIREGVSIEINGLKYQLIISAENNLKYTFAIKEEELTLTERAEIKQNIDFSKAESNVVLSALILYAA